MAIMAMSILQKKNNQDQEDWEMKTYQKVEIEVLQIEEDVVRTSPVTESTAEDLNVFDDLIFNFGA